MVTQRAFRDVLGRFATGVGVMTTVADGVVHGMTVNSITSVSLEPLLVLVCVERNTVMNRMVTASGSFALSFLHEDDAGIATHFADPYRADGHDEFAGIPHATAVTGAPILEASTGWVDLRVVGVHPGGDHDIVVGEVLALGVGARHDPLIFHRGAYRSLRPEGT